MRFIRVRGPLIRMRIFIEPLLTRFNHALHAYSLRDGERAFALDVPPRVRCHLDTQPIRRRCETDARAVAHGAPFAALS
jgi:hypothetical protein